MYVVQTSLPWTEEERASVLAHLDRLLESPAFNGSRRRQAFLRYVVEQTLAGSGAAIKERNIAVDVFDRSDDFDAQSASIVRVTGGEVRKRLAQAYATGVEGRVRIELPLGSYQPVFHFGAETMPAPAPVRPPEIHAAVPVTLPKRSPLPWLLVGAGVVVAAAIFLLPGMARGTSAGDRLWQPFLNHDQPVLISLATITRPAAREGDGAAFVGTGGALGAARFAEQLALRHQPFALKFGNDASFSDLKRTAAILIGGTRWSDELMKTLPFRIERDERGQGKAVIDSQGQNHRWSDLAAGDASEGYSIVTRLIHSESGHPVILIVGLDPRDTQAGVEFLADERLFEKFSGTAPADWTRRNFQIVLHERIFGNSPGSLNVVASHIW